MAGTRGNSYANGDSWANGKPGGLGWHSGFQADLAVTRVSIWSFLEPGPGGK